MLFSEIYSAYYNAVANLINSAIDGELNSKTANEVINDAAFGESFVYILDAIKTEQWQVITKDFKTPLKNKTSMPMTTLQLRFLKAISLDKRFRLFSDSMEGLEGIEPLFVEKDFYCFDIIKDGDPYENAEYIKNFRTVLQALKENRLLKILYESGKGYSRQSTFTPRKLEYSSKDDKFRLICRGNYNFATINIARIKRCELLAEYDINAVKTYKRRKSSITLEINDNRNSLERIMLNFANFEKETQQIDDRRYKMKLTFNREDETEVLIRVLSFGPMIKVTEPQSFIEQLKCRINNQKKLRTI